MFRTTLASVLALVCALAVAPSTGCGGGGGGGSSGGAILTPSVSAVSPVNGSTEVSIHSTQVVVTFSTDMNAATIDSTSFLVEDVNGAPVAVGGDVAYDANLRQATWTLTQVGLNTSTPGLAASQVWAFNTLYRVTLTNAVRGGTNNLPVVPALQSFFRTSATEFGIVAAGTAPQNNATDVLIDPYRVAINGSVAFATLKVQIDVPLNGSTVLAMSGGTSSNVQLRLGSATGTVVPTGVGFDSTSNTIYVAPLGASDPNPTFPGEPLLQTNTDYVLVLTTGLQDTSGNSPQGPLLIAFKTINCQIRAPAFLPAAGGSVDMVLAEAFAGPTPSNPSASDSNGDGNTTSTGEDEFAEIVNISTDYLNIIGHKYADSGNIGTPNGFLIQWTTTTLPAGTRHLALVAPGASIVIWNGPAGAGPTNLSLVPAAVPASTVTIGHSKAFFAGKLLTGMMANGGDTVIMQSLTPPSGGSGNVLNETFTTVSLPSLASAVRSGGTSGAFVNHRAAAGSSGLPWSPGKQTNGAIYK